MLNLSIFFAVVLLFSSINPTLFIYIPSFILLSLSALRYSTFFRKDLYLLFIPIILSLASVLQGGTPIYFIRLLLVSAIALLLVRLNLLHKIILYSSRLLFFLVSLETVLNYFRLPIFYWLFGIPLNKWPYRPIFLFLEPNNYSIYASSLLILGIYFSFLFSSSYLTHNGYSCAKFRLPPLGSLLKSEYFVLPSISLLLIRSTYGLSVLFVFYILLLICSFIVFTLRSQLKINSYLLLFLVSSVSLVSYFYLSPSSYIVGKISHELFDGSLRLESILQGLSIVQDNFPFGVGSPNSKYIVYSNSSLIQSLYPNQSSHLILLDGLKQLAEYGAIYFLIYFVPIFAILRSKSALSFYSSLLLFFGFLLLQLSPSSHYTLTYWIIYFLMSSPALLYESPVSTSSRFSE